jgi:hypothetical protein
MFVGRGIERVVGGRPGHNDRCVKGKVKSQRGKRGKCGEIRRMKEEGCCGRDEMKVGGLFITGGPFVITTPLSQRESDVPPAPILIPRQPLASSSSSPPIL